MRRVVCPEIFAAFSQPPPAHPSFSPEKNGALLANSQGRSLDIAWQLADCPCVLYFFPAHPTTRRPDNSSVSCWGHAAEILMGHGLRRGVECVEWWPEKDFLFHRPFASDRQPDDSSPEHPAKFLVGHGPRRVVGCVE